jgi:lipid-A-disaccharide synthase
MKYYIIAGEASGDLHASNLMKALLEKDPKADFRYWGGDRMREVGGTLVKHYKELSFMGFAEILKNLPTIFGNLKFCKKDIANFQPDMVIFIDYSGFNLRIAKWAKQEGFYTNYYISPQIWASRAKRVHAIKRDVNAVFVILPFVKEFYKKYDVEVDFVGHPLIDAIAQRDQVDETNFRRQNNLNEKPIIALLPGSRKQEISAMLSGMLSLVDDFKEYQFVIAGAPSQDYDFYQTFVKGQDVKFIENQTYALLSIATAALVTSGTATLETALFKVPQVVCYKANAISYAIAKRIITLEFISLVNLIMNREVVKELIQKEFTKENLKGELAKLLKEDTRREMLESYEALEQKLGGAGASEKAARLMLQKYFQKNKTQG